MPLTPGYFLCVLPGRGGSCLPLLALWGQPLVPQPPVKKALRLSQLPATQPGVC